MECNILLLMVVNTWFVLRKRESMREHQRGEETEQAKVGSHVVPNTLVTQLGQTHDSRTAFGKCNDNIKAPNYSHNVHSQRFL